MSWTTDIPVPRVVDGQTTFSSSCLNRIIDALTARTDDLNSRLDTLTNPEDPNRTVGGRQGYILPDIGFSNSCEVGDLVAYIPRDDENENPSQMGGMYVPAAARWSKATRADGSWVPAKEAYVKGVLISKNADSTSGVILCEGWTSDPEIVAALAPGGVVGDYYLTADGSGSAVTGDAITHDMRVYCYSYLGSGKIFVKPETPEYGGHSHNYVGIPNEAWVAANTVSAPIPEEAKYVVDASYNEALAELVKTVSELLTEDNTKYLCLVKNGSEVMPPDWGLVSNSDGQFIYVNFIILPTDEFSIHAITPLTANEPIVRSVKPTSTNKLLTIDTTGGNVFIGVNNTPVATNTLTGTCVTAINSEGISTGPVIHALKAGPGIRLANYANRGVNVPGTWILSATQFSGSLIDMNVCNLDRVVMGTAFDGISYVFPEGANGATLIGTMRIPHLEEAEPTAGELVLVFLGTGNAVSGLTPLITVQPIPSADNLTVPVSIRTAFDPVNITSTSLSNCYRHTVSLGAILQSDSLVICKLVSDGTVGITLISASIRFS